MGRFTLPGFPLGQEHGCGHLFPHHLGWSCALFVNKTPAQWTVNDPGCTWRWQFLDSVGIASSLHLTRMITPGPCHHQDGSLLYTLPLTLPRYLFITHICGPQCRAVSQSLGRRAWKRSFWISTPRDPYGHWIVHLILTLLFSENKVLCDDAVAHAERSVWNTILTVFTRKINPYSSQLRCYFLRKTFTTVFALHSPRPPYPQHTAASPPPPSARSSLCICHELNMLICLHIPLTCHSRLSSSKRWTLFLTLKTSLCLVSSVHLISITWINMV